ncbi:S8 family serine peptidase [Corynebacterium phoceense]
MRRLVLVAGIAAACALVPPALAQEPATACMVPVPGEGSPAPTAQQADYRARLHALATGRGVRVAVIDTGVARHDQLARLESGPDLVAPDSPDPHLDCDMHGTVVAGVIAARDTGIAPSATIFSIRQSSAHYRSDARDAEARGAGDLESLARAITAAVDADADVINVSVVSCVAPAIAAKLNTRPLDDALRLAEDSGALIVAAAGNTGGSGSGCSPGDVVYPAHGPTVLSVAAVEEPRDHADYSLPGRLAAPGTVPLGLSPTGGWARGDAASPLALAADEVQPLTGTSFAAPVIAGTAALLRERFPDATPAQLRERLHATAHPGSGFVDPLAAVSATTFSQSRVVRPAFVAHPAQRDAEPARRLAWLAGSLAFLALAIACAAALRPRRIREEDCFNARHVT